MKYYFGRQLAMTHKAVRAEFDARFTAAGASLSTWIVLRSAEESEGPWGLSQRELAERMGVEGPTLVRHLDRLEKEDLIERRRDVADRRVTRIAVTAAGRVLLEELSVVAEAVEGEIRALIGAEDYELLVNALDALRAAMARLAGERKMHAHAAHGA
ncbi:MAG: MarR family transcriptional regulator [Actinomycetota bacterium]